MVEKTTILLTNPAGIERAEFKEKIEPKYNEKTGVYHFKRFRKYLPMKIGSYRQKRK